MFTPNEVGEYKVHVEYNSVPIKGSPFNVNVANPKEARMVVDTETIVRTTSTCTMTVNMDERAGKGDMQVVVTDPDGGNVPADLVPVGNGREISFAPAKTGNF